MENGDRTDFTSAERSEIFCLMNEPLMVQLIFEPTEDLKQIFKHTKEAKEWSNPYGLMPEMTTEMHIDFVKDTGIYIMSGNKETLPGENSTNMIAYAKGYHPKKDNFVYNRSRDAVGGDDFCEPLPVDDEIINQILEGAGFFIRINGEKWSYGTFTPTAHV